MATFFVPKRQDARISFGRSSAGVGLGLHFGFAIEACRGDELAEMSWVPTALRPCNTGTQQGWGSKWQETRQFGVDHEQVPCPVDRLYAFSFTLVTKH